MKKFFRAIVVLAFLLQLVSGCSSSKDEIKVGEIVDSLKVRFAPDKRTAIYDIAVISHSGKIILKGETDNENAKQSILDSLIALNINVIDSIAVLPDSKLKGKTWGLVTLSFTNLRSKPEHSAEIVSQALLGTPLRVLQKENGWYRVQTPDKYIGWMDDSAIERLTDDELIEWKKSQRFFFNQTNGYAYELPSVESPVVSDLVLGDLFEVESEIGDFYAVKFPDGRKANILKKDCFSYQEMVAKKTNIDAAIEVAKKLLGSSYFWGGTTTKAVDCSGLTKTAYFSQGVILARDASQQARYGEHPDFNNRKNLEPGDLLFFGKNAKRITHVGLYIGNDLYIHSSGLVRINSLNPEAVSYLPGTLERLVATSRVINSLDNEGIAKIGSHPWYN